MTSSKSPIDYVNRFIMRVHPDLFHGEKAMVIDHKRTLGIAPSITDDQRGIKAKKQQFTPAPASNPNADDVSYYLGSVDRMREVNQTNLAKLNDLVAVLKATDKSGMDLADPFSNQDLSHLKRSMLVFYIRSKDGNPFTVPEGVRRVQSPYEVTFWEGEDRELKAPNFQNKTSSQGLPTAKRTSITKTDTADPDEQDDKEDEIDDLLAMNESTVHSNSDVLKYESHPFENITVEDCEQLPHVRRIKVRFRPPTDISKTVPSASGQSRVTMLDLAVERLLIELYDVLGDEVPNGELEEWKVHIHSFQERDVWLRRDTVRSNRALQKFQASKDDINAGEGADDDMLFTTFRGYQNEFVTKSEAAREAFSQHPRFFLANAILHSGFASFEKDVDVSARSVAAGSLHEAIKDHYSALSGWRWWSREMTKREQYENKEHQRYFSNYTDDHLKHTDPENRHSELLFDEDGNPIKKTDDGEEPIGILLNNPDIEGKSEQWPDTRAGRQYRLQLSIHFTRPDAPYFAPRLVSTSYRRFLALRSYAEVGMRPGKPCLHASKIRKEYYLPPIPPSAFATYPDIEERVALNRMPAYVPPLSRADACLEVRIPWTFTAETLAEYLEEKAWPVLDHWEALALKDSRPFSTSKLLPSGMPSELDLFHAEQYYRVAIRDALERERVRPLSLEEEMTRESSNPIVEAMVGHEVGKAFKKLRDNASHLSISPANLQLYDEDAMNPHRKLQRPGVVAESNILGELSTLYGRTTLTESQKKIRFILDNGLNTQIPVYALVIPIPHYYVRNIARVMGCKIDTVREVIAKSAGSLLGGKTVPLKVRFEDPASAPEVSSEPDFSQEVLLESEAISINSDHNSTWSQAQPAAVNEAEKPIISPKVSLKSMKFGNKIKLNVGKTED